MTKRKYPYKFWNRRRRSQLLRLLALKYPPDQMALILDCSLLSLKGILQSMGISYPQYRRKYTAPKYDTMPEHVKYD